MYTRVCYESGWRMEFKVAIRQAMVACNKGARPPSIKGLDAAFETLLPTLSKVFDVEREKDNHALPVFRVPYGVVNYAWAAMWSTTLWLYSTEALWRHVDAVLKAKFPSLKVNERDRILQRLQGDKDAKPAFWGEDARACWAWLASQGSLVSRFEKHRSLVAAEATCCKEEKIILREDVMTEAVCIRLDLLRIMEKEIVADPELDTRFKRFSTIPAFSVKRHFIRVDKEVLKDLVRWLLPPIKRSRKRSRQTEGETEASEPSKKAGRKAPAKARPTPVSEPKGKKRGRGEKRDDEKPSKPDAGDGEDADLIPVSVRPAETVPASRKAVKHDGEETGKKRNNEEMVDDGVNSFEWPELGGREVDLATPEGREPFMDMVEVTHLLRLPRKQVRKVTKIPNSWTTDGVQLHIAFEQVYTREVLWPKGRELPSQPLKPKDDIASSRASDFVERRWGLFRSDCVRMRHLEGSRQLDGGADFNLCFVDPGAAFVFTAVSVPFGEWKARGGKVDSGEPMRRGEASSGQAEGVRLGAMRRAEYYHRIGGTQDRFRGDAFYKHLHSSKDAWRCGWTPPEVRQAWESLSEGGSMKVAGTKAAVEAACKRIEMLLAGDVWRFVSSRTHAQLKFRRTMRKQRALDKLANELAPGKNDVVVMGSWFGRRALKGEDMASPVKTVRRHLQKRRRVLVMDEFNYSCKCARCGPDLGKNCEHVTHPHRTRMLGRRSWEKAVERREVRDGCELPVVEREKLRLASRCINGLSVCPHCESCWSRDVNAGCNFSYGFFSTASTSKGERPLYMRRAKADVHSVGAPASDG